MDGEISDVTVVGGGDAGLLTALCLRQVNPGLDITVVDDFDEENSDVGKSTFQAIVGVLHDFLEIPIEQFVREVRPIFKASVYFRDWCGYDRFHHPFDVWEVYPDDPGPDMAERYAHLYETVFTDPEYRTLGEELAESGKTPFYIDENGQIDDYPYFAYHLNTGRFNRFLRDTCEERGVEIRDDLIETVTVADGADRIEAVDGRERSYDADLYVDASGFTRVLKGELDGTFRDFDLPLDAAFNAKAERPLSEVEPATVIETGAYGWFWQIDTFDNRDLGYVYASEYVDEAAARREFLAHCDADIEETDLKTYEFRSGYYEDAWVGNCLSIGNAEGFVEPLQSTGLTANAQAAQVLSVLLAGRGRVNSPGLREQYNAYVRNAWESIYDFVSAHYRYADGDTAFWERMQSIETSPRTDHIVRAFEETGLTVAESFDFQSLQHDPESNDLVYFPASSFHSIMRKMGATSPFHEEAGVAVSEALRQERERHFESVRADAENYLGVDEFYEGYLGTGESDAETTRSVPEDDLDWDLRAIEILTAVSMAGGRKRLAALIDELGPEAATVREMCEQMAAEGLLEERGRDSVVITQAGRQFLDE